VRGDEVREFVLMLEDVIEIGTEHQIVNAEDRSLDITIPETALLEIVPRAVYEFLTIYMVEVCRLFHVPDGRRVDGGDAVP